MLKVSADTLQRLEINIRKITKKLYSDITYVLCILVEALRYKPEGRGIDSRWCHQNFSLI
jgi:hypothetical protein